MALETKVQPIPCRRTQLLIVKGPSGLLKRVYIHHNTTVETHQKPRYVMK